jgi:hypothetical protein
MQIRGVQQVPSWPATHCQFLLLPSPIFFFSIIRIWGGYPLPAQNSIKMSCAIMDESGDILFHNQKKLNWFCVPRYYSKARKRPGQGEKHESKDLSLAIGCVVYSGHKIQFN